MRLLMLMLESFALVDGDDDVHMTSHISYVDVVVCHSLHEEQKPLLSTEKLVLPKIAVDALKTRIRVSNQ